jgi:triphosphoribosyl-dephospho-CoA synthase
VTNDFIVTAAQVACLLEASAPKPGNVSPGRHFEDARYEDFLASAAAIGPALASDLPLGATIHAAVRATAQWTRSNTNLGLVLLLTPLARAAREPAPLRDAVHEVLAATTVQDAREVYAAIRLARPGGMGQVTEEDVEREPSVTLVDAMRLAAARDSIAGEYADDYPVTFGVGLRAVQAARSEGLEWEATTVRTFLALLAAIPDTHISRQRGHAVAVAVSARAHEVVSAGPDALAAFDRELRSDGLNPGATADLTTAALFVALLSGLWHPTP